MAKSRITLPDPTDILKKESSPESVRVIAFFKEEGAAYGITEVEIDKEVLQKHGRVAYKSNADIWSITENQLIKKAREIFGL